MPKLLVTYGRYLSNNGISLGRGLGMFKVVGGDNVGNGHLTYLMQLPMGLRGIACDFGNFRRSIITSLQTS